MKISSLYSLGRIAAIGAVALTLSACVVDPYPPPPVAYAPPPPPGPVAVAPAPGPYYAAPAPAYYAAPCCYAYPEYPAYANVGLSFGGGWGGGGHRWR